MPAPKTPLDQPFVCKVGHITEAGWEGPSGSRCLMCTRLRRRRSFANHYRKNRESYLRRAAEFYRNNTEYCKRRVKNYRRGVGRDIANRLGREYRARHREEVNRRGRERKAKLVADGLALTRKGVLIGIPPTLLAKLRSEMGNP